MILKLYCDGEVIEEIIPLCLYKIKIKHSLLPNKEIICGMSPDFPHTFFMNKKIPLVIGEIVKIHTEGEYGIILKK